MGAPDLKSLVNISGYGRAREELIRTGHLDPYDNGTEPVEYSIKADCIKSVFEAFTIEARSEEEAKSLARKELRHQYDEVSIVEVVRQADD